jgi:benzoylformate decarboxylase
MASHATVREAVLTLLRSFGMTTIFGNPGSTELPLFREFPSDLRYVLGLAPQPPAGLPYGLMPGTSFRLVISREFPASG